MASLTPMMPFLRPLGLPRPQTVRHFLRFSTATPCREAAQREDRNLAASRTAPESYPPPSMKSLPRPKESKASRRTSYPLKERHYPTRHQSHHQPQVPKLIPQPVQPLSPERCAPNLPYFVTRSANNELPIYTLRKRGGNLKMTRVKKIDGDRLRLRDALRVALGVADKDAVVNSVTGHIMIKGHHKPRIEKFLRERKF
ncbi:hypothetical protein CLAFUW4_12940 [Fulvia fulva]|uniref:Large ribosomal subunit protein mL49 n=1 Tax=Passalora fulva TaxID=5499 RepID=A0A9Q8PJ72_PASFU|nr:uncharacterized protein CLAFUR5_12805 [Fulvia fulva]KAK4611640.1 hypothetical protein CLAFUR4_12944 [Fulvia fulva]KAK4612792.1 hypothetical protein CLAFUR0_12950 [Fulvia fulva]UJO23407.1 hypothetical protein CLAFUR5_12805 [Fulvia fulva]WPV21583.1 hypothetical protein CLAFUW4_12940 [Fulvia fulva]WPV35866.1 hypothetical protein CLAFUW7_12947 [Fulvia fulva]